MKRGRKRVVINEALADYLLTLRTEKKIDQETIAKLAKVTIPCISRFETKTVNPSFNIIAAYIVACDDEPANVVKIYASYFIDNLSDAVKKIALQQFKEAML